MDGVVVEAVTDGVEAAVVGVLLAAGGGVRAIMDDRPKAAASALDGFDLIESDEEETLACFLVNRLFLADMQPNLFHLKRYKRNN